MHSPLAPDSSTLVCRCRIKIYLSFLSGSYSSPFPAAVVGDFNSHLCQPLPLQLAAKGDDSLFERISPGAVTIQYRYDEL